MCNQGSFVKDVKIFDLTLEGFGLESVKLENPVETTNTLNTTATNTLCDMSRGTQNRLIA